MTQRTRPTFSGAVGAVSSTKLLTIHNSSSPLLERSSSTQLCTNNRCHRQTARRLLGHRRDKATTDTQVTREACLHDLSGPAVMNASHGSGRDPLTCLQSDSATRHELEQEARGAYRAIGEG